MIILQLDSEQLNVLIQTAVKSALGNLITMPSSQANDDELLTVKDAAKFLSLSVPTIYGLISKGELPVMKRSKRCYFSKVDLMQYLKDGRKKTITEIKLAANKYTKNEAL